MRDTKKSIELYRQRRKNRLNKRKPSDDRMDSVEAFYERRNERLCKRNLPEKTLSRGVDKRGGKWYNEDAGKRRFDAFEPNDTLNGEDIQWITTSQGKHIALNGKGQIIAGPNELKGRHISEVKEAAKNRSSESSGAKESGSSNAPASTHGGQGQSKKEYKPSAVYEKYKNDAAKKIQGVFPQNDKYATGVNYKGRKVPLRFQSEEAQKIFDRIQDPKMPNYTVDELKNTETVKQLDELSDKCTDAIGGMTYKINTPEREALRQEIKDRFLSLGSARLNENGKTVAFDNPVKKEFKAVIYTGLPAVGKSTAVDPLSQEQGMFVFDNDTIKGMIPEFEATGGAAANAVHKESSDIQKSCMQEFLAGGSRNGDNVAYPTIGDDFDKVMDTIKKFEDAGYNVEVRCLEADPGLSASRAMARAIETGRIIKSNVILGYGDKPHTTYHMIEDYDKEHGTHYAAGMSKAK